MTICKTKPVMAEDVENGNDEYWNKLAEQRKENAILSEFAEERKGKDEKWKKENTKLLELLRDCEKEKEKQKTDMIDLERKLVEYQKKNEKLFELLSDGKQGMANASYSTENNSPSIPRKITGVDMVLSTQQGLEWQLSEVNKENVTLWKFVEEYKKGNSKLQMEVIHLRQKLVEQQKQNMMLELEDDCEKEDYTLLKEVIDLRKKLVEQQKQNMLLELEDNSSPSILDKNRKLQLDMIELENKLMEQQKENKKLLELAEDHETEKGKLQMVMIEMERELLALQTEVKYKDEALQKSVQQPSLMNECIANNGMQELRKDLMELYKKNINPQGLIGVKRERELDGAAFLDTVKRMLSKKGL